VAGAAGGFVAAAGAAGWVGAGAVPPQAARALASIKKARIKEIVLLVDICFSPLCERITNGAGLAE